MTKPKRVLSFETMEYDWVEVPIPMQKELLPPEEEEIPPQGKGETPASHQSRAMDEAERRRENLVDNERET